MWYWWQGWDKDELIGFLVNLVYANCTLLPIIQDSLCSYFVHKTSFWTWTMTIIFSENSLG